MKPEFLYFDMGNVLLRFSHERMAEQMSRVVGTDPSTAWRVLFDGASGLHWPYERGEFSREHFYARFCEAASVRLPDVDALDAAANDIFELNAPIIGLVGRLSAAGYRLGVCSNTTQSHWTHCTSRFGALTTVFPVHALSFRLRAMKPDPRFYIAATKLAGIVPEQILFTDDRADNVAAAQAAGWDAVQFESVSQLNQAFRSRGFVLNY
jgi:putative hydrolase of the HAD superfamily